MLLPKRIKSRKKGSLKSNIEKVQYDFVETDDIVSKVYKDECDEPVSVMTNIVSIDPLTLEHVATIGDEVMKMAECTYRMAVEIMLYNTNYSLVDFNPNVSEDGEVFYEVIKVPLECKIDDRKRRILY